MANPLLQVRQLRVEGWIHHLARHMVACFLTRGGCSGSALPGHLSRVSADSLSSGSSRPGVRRFHLVITNRKST